MLTELEAAAADSVGSFFRRKPSHALPIGTPCPNCKTPLEGPWCHACGQKGEEFHRSIGHLLSEAIEGLTHFDGRIWQTLPPLIRDPASLTRGFLDGHRAPQIPPFRLFLIVVVIVFFAGSLNTGTNTHVVAPHPNQQVAPDVVLDVNAKDPPSKNAVGRWLVEHGRAAAREPEKFQLGMEIWGHRLAILAMPLAALLLGLVFIGRRRFYLFDHLIFSMHSLSFLGLLVSLDLLLSQVIGDWAQFLLLAAPVHLFVHLRGVYGVGVFGALWRMTVLLIGSAIGGTLLMGALVLLGLNAVGGHA